MIKGGYILQPRIIQESDISVAPPYVREIWNYLLREANSHDNKYNGHQIKRGQLFRSYQDIREDTKWYVGWRAQKYTESQTKHAMKFLRDTLRITTMKELGGVLITICKYEYYQDPKNYERTTKDTKDRTIEEPIENHTPPDINKNDKNDKNEIHKAWKDDFETYKSGLMETYNSLIIDSTFIIEQEKFHPGVDISLSLEKAVTNFWGTEAGWKHKKKSRSKELNWRSTLTNAIDLNKVYKQREQNKSSERHYKVFDENTPVQ